MEGTDIRTANKTSYGPFQPLQELCFSKLGRSSSLQDLASGHTLELLSSSPSVLSGDCSTPPICPENSIGGPPQALADARNCQMMQGQRKTGRPIRYEGDPDSPHLTPAERRQLRRRVANRESARRTRNRLQEKAKELEMQMTLLGKRNEALIFQTGHMARETQHLEQLIKETELAAQQAAAKNTQLRHESKALFHMFRSSAEPDSGHNFQGLGDCVGNSDGLSASTVIEAMQPVTPATPFAAAASSLLDEQNEGTDLLADQAMGLDPLLDPLPLARTSLELLASNMGLHSLEA